MEPPGIGLTGLDRVGLALGIGLDPSQRRQITGKGLGRPGAAGVFPLGLGRQVPLPTGWDQTLSSMPLGQRPAIVLRLSPIDLIDRLVRSFPMTGILRHDRFPLSLGALGLCHEESPTELDLMLHLVFVPVGLIHRTAHDKSTRRHPTNGPTVRPECHGDAGSRRQSPGIFPDCWSACHGCRNAHRRPGRYRGNRFSSLGSACSHDKEPGGSQEDDPIQTGHSDVN